MHLIPHQEALGERTDQRSRQYSGRRIGASERQQSGEFEASQELGRSSLYLNHQQPPRSGSIHSSSASTNYGSDRYRPRRSSIRRRHRSHETGNFNNRRRSASPSGHQRPLDFNLNCSSSEPARYSSESYRYWQRDITPGQHRQSSGSLRMYHSDLSSSPPEYNDSRPGSGLSTTYINERAGFGFNTNRSRSPPSFSHSPNTQTQPRDGVLAANGNDRSCGLGRYVVDHEYFARGAHCDDADYADADHEDNVEQSAAADNNNNDNKAADTKSTKGRIPQNPASNTNLQSVNNNATTPLSARTASRVAHFQEWTRWTNDYDSICNLLKSYTC